MAYKYIKGSFLTVPNKETLRGMKPIYQVTFFWICNYADEQGVCFPSRKKLPEETGLSIDRIDVAIKELIKVGLIEKTARKQGEINLSNLYQINLVAVKTTLPSRENDPTPSRENKVLTQSNINSIQLTQLTAKAENNIFRSYLEKFTPEESKRLSKIYNCSSDKVSEEAKAMLMWADGYKKKIPNFKRAFELRLMNKYGLKKKDHLAVDKSTSLRAY